MKKKHPSIRIFRSDVLERLTHVHPITPLILWFPVACWLLWRSFAVHDLSVVAVSVLGTMGFVTWTFTEYVLHRFVFHMNPRNAMQERVQYLLHGLHHEDPGDPTRLVMPPLPAIFFALVLFSVFRMGLGEENVEPFFAFFLVGYLVYDYLHFAMHHFRIGTRMGRRLKQNHMIHHYVNSDALWGVSSPVWDWVFGTLHHQEAVSTARRGDSSARGSRPRGGAK